MERRIELLWANHAKLKRGQQMKEHSHTCFQLYYVVSGSPTYRVGDSVVRSTPGTYFLVPPSTPHSMLPLESADSMDCYEFKFIVHDKKLYDRLPGALLKKDTGEIQSFLTYAVKNWRYPAPENITDIDSLLSAVLISFCLDKVSYKDPDSIFITANRYSPLVRSMITYIERHYPYNYTLSKMAAKLNYNPNYLSSLFRNETGYMIMEYVNTLRLRYAVICFVYYGQDVASAYECSGFNDGSYFSRKFKESIGISPRAFKAMLSDDTWRKTNPDFFQEPILSYKICSMKELIESLSCLGKYYYKSSALSDY